MELSINDDIRVWQFQQQRPLCRITNLRRGATGSAAGNDRDSQSALMVLRPVQFTRVIGRPLKVIGCAGAALQINSLNNDAAFVILKEINKRSGRAFFYRRVMAVAPIPQGKLRWKSHEIIPIAGSFEVKA